MPKDSPPQATSVTSRRFYDAYARGYAAYLSAMPGISAPSSRR